MKLDICIPTYRNLPSLRVVAAGIKRHLAQPQDATVLLYVQEPAEFVEALKAFSDCGLACRIVGTLTDLGDHGRPGTVGAVHWMDHLFRAASSPWLIMTEQDFFPLVEIDTFASELAANGYVAGAPMDTMYYDNPNARGREMYGRYGRLCGEPGFFHSAFMVINREWFAARTKSPFTMPPNYKWWGQGVLGGEWYYGLRLHVADAGKLAFFRQLHADYAYGAEIYFNKRLLGVHLYHSSDVLKRQPADLAAWRQAEEQRFFQDYQAGKLSQCALVKITEKELVL